MVSWGGWVRGPSDRGRPSPPMDHMQVDSVHEEPEKPTSAFPVHSLLGTPPSTERRRRTAVDTPPTFDDTHEPQVPPVVFSPGRDSSEDTWRSSQSGDRRIHNRGVKKRSRRHPNTWTSQLGRWHGFDAGHDGGLHSSWIPNAPYVVTGYIQVAFNMVVVGLMCYIVYWFFANVQEDVDKKIEEYSQEILGEIALCSKNYMDNRCRPEERIPAMEVTCNTWERCMNRDPTVVGRTRVSAETLGEIINSFLEPLSIKTMVFLTLFVFGFIVASNMAFQFTRTRLSYGTSDPPQFSSLTGPNVFTSPYRH